jgi:tRNA threonylcarbamoyl adenosine modification protein YjeE
MQACRFILEGVNAQRAFGESIGKAISLAFEQDPILQEQLKIGVLGEVGSGKTSCAQGLAVGLGVSLEAYINSPTFAMLQSHQGKYPFHHIDLYRLESASELYGLGLEELISHGVCYIEWVQRAPEILGDIYLLIAFEHLWDSEWEGIARQATIKMITESVMAERVPSEQAYLKLFESMLASLKLEFKTA